MGLNGIYWDLMGFNGINIHTLLLKPWPNRKFVDFPI